MLQSRWGPLLLLQPLQRHLHRQLLLRLHPAFSLRPALSLSHSMSTRYGPSWALAMFLL